MELEVFNVQSAQRQQRDDNSVTTGRSPLVSAVHANCLRTATLLFMAYGTRDFQYSIRTTATKRRQLSNNWPISTRVRRHANCLRTVTLLFMAYGTRDFQHSIRTTATKRRQLSHSCAPSMRSACGLRIFFSWK